jgi:23S rRNA (cytosine1962-C5)-methyltransferase
MQFIMNVLKKKCNKFTISSMQQVILKKGREKSVKQKHCWLFSGALHSSLEDTLDPFLAVKSFEGEHLGYAYFNRKCSLIGRFVSFDDKDPLVSIKNSLKKAFKERETFFKNEETTGYRLVNGEADGIPGLILDKYGDVLVLQIATLGLERVKSQIVSMIVDELSPKTVFEKSKLPARTEEGLPPFEGVLFGEDVDEVIIKERGRSFIVSLHSGQKTGFFLDMREMRTLIGSLAYEKKVLNAFSYTGGFSVFAANGGAKEVVSLDASRNAVDMASRNMALNGFQNTHQGVTSDAFDYLQTNPLNFDLIILDPPAFAKKKGDLRRAQGAYRTLNRLAFEKVEKNTLILTCSCSYHLDEESFKKIIFQAALEAKRDVVILSGHRQAFDHPVSVFHPEGHYLKSFLLSVR